MRTLFALFTLLGLCVSVQAASVNEPLHRSTYTSACALGTAIFAEEEPEEESEDDEEPDCE